jgi:ABC-type hemin transport system ATPase subunit
MGRPPIGKQPMTGAERQRRYLARLLRDGERQRRYLARLLRDGKTASKPAGPNDEIIALKKELAAAKARITALLSGRRKR